MRACHCDDLQVSCCLLSAAVLAVNVLLQRSRRQPVRAYDNRARRPQQGFKSFVALSWEIKRMESLHGIYVCFYSTTTAAAAHALYVPPPLRSTGIVRLDSRFFESSLACEPIASPSAKLRVVSSWARWVNAFSRWSSLRPAAICTLSAHGSLSTVSNHSHQGSP